MLYILLAFIGIISGMISGVVGTGSSIILLPILAYIFGAKLAVPIMAIASIMGNVSRVVIWRKELNYKAFCLFASLGIPCTILGAKTLWMISPKLSSLFIGLFFLLLIPLRHWAKKNHYQLKNWHMVIAGGILGYLTGVVFSTGPLLLPVFSSYGLSKGALLATEAATSFAMYLSKSFTFGALGVLDFKILISGILVGLTLIIGNYIGKVFVLKMSERTFNLMLDAMLLLAACSMLIEVFMH